MTTQKLRLPVSNSSPWNQSNPFINLNNFDNFGNIPSHSGLIEIYNLSGYFLGLGLYSEETKMISFLSHENSDLDKILIKKLADACHKRKEFYKHFSAYRIIHHKHDGLPGIVIEKYNDVYVIRTYDSAADKLIPNIQKILLDTYNAQAVLLKNHFPKRKKNNLPLSDQILAGSLVEDELTLHESDYTLNYNCKNQNLFPLQARPLRNWFYEITNTLQESSILLLNLNSEDTICNEAKEKIKAFKEIQFKDLNFSNQTESLRQLNQIKDPCFDIIIYKQDPTPWTPKNQTALFHQYYQILKLLKIPGYLLLQTANWNHWKQLMKLACTKANRQMTIINKTKDVFDFPKQQIEFLQLYVD